MAKMFNSFYTISLQAVRIFEIIFFRSLVVHLYSDSSVNAFETEFSRANGTQL